MTKITACLMLKNEADKLEGLLDNLEGFADQIVAIDHESTDGTQGILYAHNIQFKVVPQGKNWVDKDREILFGMVKDGWILHIDADERLPEDTKHYLKTFGAYPGDHTNAVVWLWSLHMINEKRWLEWGFWAPHYEPRFFRTSMKPNWDVKLHQQPTFPEDAKHYFSQANYEHHYYLAGWDRIKARHDQYIEMEHKQKGKPSGLSVAAGYPFWLFVGLVWKLGVFDRWEGIKANVFLAGYFARARGLKR